MNIYTKHIKRLIIIGKFDGESDKAWEYCKQNNLHVVRSGPKPLSRFTVSTTHFKIVAEIEEGVRSHK